jgi:acylphosphatase
MPDGGGAGALPEDDARGFRVVGRVQGVGFRWWARRTAKALGVSGWVRNLPDGSVEVQASGSRVALEQLEARLHKGPTAARVDRVERLPWDPSARRSGFDIEA